MDRQLLVASYNPGKLEELLTIMADWPARLVRPRDIGLHLDVAETGATYAENARLKAVAHVEVSGLWTLADDSGLEVDALGGAPGIRAARYAGEGADNAERWALLLRNLDGVPWERRTARFRAVVALAQPGGKIAYAEGAVEGYIMFEPKGSGGFGYDPLFYIPEFDSTMAELPPEIKNRISHRARSIQAARPIYERWFSKG
jgi:XTP/dITP diphosphohydrolase